MNLEENWDYIDNKILEYLKLYWYEANKVILWQYTKQLSENKFDPEKIKIPETKEYKANLKKLMLEAVKIGMSSAKQMMEKEQVKIDIPSKYKKWIDKRITDLADKHEHDFLFQIKIGIEDILEFKGPPYSRRDILSALNNTRGHYRVTLWHIVKQDSGYITREGIKLGRQITTEQI